jgi:hypothetical protein
MECYHCRCGILETIIKTMISTGRFKFNIFQEQGVPFSLPKETSMIKKLKKWARGVITCRRLKVVARQASVRMQLRRQQKLTFNDFTAVHYAEQIKTINVKMLKLLNSQDSHFDDYIKNESTAVH